MNINKEIFEKVLKYGMLEKANIDGTVLTLQFQDDVKKEYDLNTLTIKDEEDCKTLYENACILYARKLCYNFDWNYDECFWVSNYIGGTFCTGDIEFSLSMNDIKLLVDNNVSFETFTEWWDYNMLISYARSNYEEYDATKPSNISITEWLHGYRSDFTVEQLKEEEKKYWSRLQSENEYKRNELDENTTKEIFKE